MYDVLEHNKNLVSSMKTLEELIVKLSEMSKYYVTISKTNTMSYRLM